MIRFEVLGVPVAKGRARHRHVKTKTGAEFNMAYTPKKTAEAEETFVARALAFAPSAPLAGPIRLSLVFVLPLPKSAPRKLRERLGDPSDMPHVKRPDLDNLEKLVKDACNGVFWIDDSQVFEVTKRKIYGAVPRTKVEIWEAMS
jgi:Holliday junction resolvase RusA-like endonuclease